VYLGIDIHLPDLTFVRQTEGNFNVNRGVYNTIDAWFYDYGLKDIVERRNHIIRFLAYSKEDVNEERAIERVFFPNGLTNALESYVVKTGLRQKTELVSLLDN
jgi:riboflavin kinase